MTSVRPLGAWERLPAAAVTIGDPHGTDGSANSVKDRVKGLHQYRFSTLLKHNARSGIRLVHLPIDPHHQDF
jgi:hypothetical protein